MKLLHTCYTCYNNIVLQDHAESLALALASTAILASGDGAASTASTDGADADAREKSVSGAANAREDEFSTLFRDDWVTDDDAMYFLNE